MGVGIAAFEAVLRAALIAALRSSVRTKHCTCELRMTAFGAALKARTHMSHADYVACEFRSRIAAFAITLIKYAYMRHGSALYKG